MSEPKIEPWIKVAVAIREAFYAKDLDRGYGQNAPRMLLSDAEIAKIILEHAPSSPAAPTPQEVQFWLAELDQYRNPTLIDGAHSDVDGANRAAYLIEAMRLGKRDRKFAVARVELLPCEPTDKGVNHQAIAQINRAKRTAPEAPTPHMTAAEFYKPWIAAHPSLSGKSVIWPGDVSIFEFAEAYAASEVARADRAEQKVEEQAQRWDEYVTPLEERLDKAEADLQRKDAALREIINRVNTFSAGTQLALRDLAEGALAPVSVPAAVTVPSPCCANPNREAQGPCEHTPSLHPFINDSFIGTCLSWVHTHNVCLNCGKEEAL